MNNRKTRNKRGKKTRGMFIQTIVEPATIKREHPETKELINIPNPRFGITKHIPHLNIVRPKKAVK